MNLTQSIILGIIQGITEFLPISSSGHLALFQNILGEVDVNLDVVLHLATLLAVFVFFSKDIIQLIRGFFSFSWKNRDFRMCVYILISSLPAGIVGFLFMKYLYGSFSNLYIVAAGFLISGMFLFTASFSRNFSVLNLKNSFIIGLGQAVALFPGISRSGSTVSTGVMLGVERKEALRFSFLLAIPVILGAVLLNFQDINLKLLNFEVVMGFVFSFVFGLLSIFVFMKLVRVGRGFRGFAYYCWVLALICLLVALF